MLKSKWEQIWKPHEINGFSPKGYNALSLTITEYYFNCSLHNYTLFCDAIAWNWITDVTLLQKKIKHYIAGSSIAF